MKRNLFCILLLAPICLVSSVAPAAGSALELVQVNRIWDAAPHNAFTDLLWHRGEWFCVFREGADHVSPDGALRVIASPDGTAWKSVALIRSDEGDLRDAKITATPDGRLMLSGAVALKQPADHKHRSLAWFSSDGRVWGKPVVIGEPNMWLWRTTWWQGAAYSIGYDTSGERFIRLYKSDDGRRFDVLVPKLFEEQYPNETSIVFDPDGIAHCLLRRDGQPGSGLMGIAHPPYTDWEWRDLGVKIGGPHLVRLPDGRLIAAVRLYDGGARTSLCWIEGRGGITEVLKLPSGGDTSYAGLVWRDDMLWVSYYSSHEGKSSIYLARIRVGLGSRK